MLVSVFDALALIRLRRTLFANFGCELTYLLLVGTGNYDLLGAGTSIVIPSTSGTIT